MRLTLWWAYLWIALCANEVKSSVYEFSGEIRDHVILPSSDSNSDETVLVWTTSGDAYVSQDFGTTWNALTSLENVVYVVKSNTDINKFIVYTGSVDNLDVHVSWDRGRSFSKLDLPAKASIRDITFSQIVSGNFQNPDWLLFHGDDCVTDFDCTKIAYVSKDRGKSWDSIYKDCTLCFWVSSDDERNEYLPELMYCQVPGQGRRMRSIYWSTNYFVEKKQRKLMGIDSVIAVIQDGRYMLGAFAQDTGPELAISRDGVHFVSAKYPPNLQRNTMSGISVINTPNSILVYEGTGTSPTRELGTVMKAGEDGTEFVEVLSNVVRPPFKSGFIDYELMKSVEGVALANVVDNIEEVNNGGEAKVSTRITHSDGSMWSQIEINGEQLNLHGYTDRLDSRNSPTAETAIGIFLGRGNTGKFLRDVIDSQTYLTRDAGISWMKVSDSPQYWGFGDNGAVLVLADVFEYTSSITYSLDEGANWNSYSWGDLEILVKSLATIPSGASRKFLVFGSSPPYYQDLKNVAVQLDFTETATRECKPSDFEKWSPEHPQLKTKCLLGHEVEYERRKRDSNCLVGKYFADNKKTPAARKIIRNCKCTRKDYECDYAYQLDPSNCQCKLISGAKVPTKEQQCESGAISWKKYVGYRKNAASTCEGSFMEVTERLACPGKEKEFKEGKQDDHYIGDDNDNGDGDNGDNGDNGDKEDDADDDNDNDDDEDSPDFFSRLFRFFKFVFVMCIIVAAGMIAYSIGKKIYSQRQHVRLPDTEDSWSHITNVWNLVRSYVPFFGSPIPRDHLGFYSRMDNDERYRIMADESDEDMFRDESEVEPEEV